MKLKISEFESVAKNSGVSANAMLTGTGGGKYAYKRLKSGCALGYGLAKDMYNVFGERKFLTFVDMEEETLDGFKSKYLNIGSKLY